MSLIIKDKVLDIPISQGGMGVGISMGQLAGSVAARGGIGTISTAMIGFREPDFYENIKEANARALKKEVEKARSISGGKGLIAANIMVASSEYESDVKSAIDAGIDAIVSGAGLPKNLPAYAENSDVLLAPVVSSGRAANVLCKLWSRHFNRIPDFIVIEGAKAGGHLGFSAYELHDNSFKNLTDILVDVKQVISEYEEKFDCKIPIFAGGGIRSKDYAQKLLSLGASGIQLATQFIATHECDASDEFKQILINATNEDILIIDSPVGMPGRALKTPLINNVKTKGRIPPEKCIKCISTCDPATTPYCISKALIDAFWGRYETGLFFCGDDIDNIKEMNNVSDIIEQYIF